MSDKGINEEVIAHDFTMAGVNKESFEEGNFVKDAVMEVALCGLIDKEPDEAIVSKLPPIVSIPVMILHATGVKQDMLFRKIALKYLVLTSLAAGKDDLQDIYNDLEEMAIAIKSRLSNS